MNVEKLNFNYNVAIDTINCINDIDYTYHIIRSDYLTLHSHNDYYEFTLVLDGEIINYRNSKKEIITKKTLFISDTKDVHYLKKSNQNMRVLNIIAREKEVIELINQLFPNNFFDFLKTNKIFTLPDEIIYIIDKNIEVVNALSSKDWKLTNSLLKSTIITILNYIFIKSINYSGNEINNNQKFIKKLNDLKSNSNFYKFDVNNLCFEFGYSRTHLNRIFYELFNESPHTYLLKCKMEYASSLLLHTDYTIDEISNLVGYTSTIRFTHNFKQIYNVSPIKYRGK